MIRTRLSWETVKKSKTSEPLEKVRATQMLDLTAGGQKIEEDVPEMVKMVLEKIEIEDPRHADVYFLDGTIIEVELASKYAWDD